MDLAAKKQFVWTALAEMFGGEAIDRAYGPVMPGTWSAALADFSEDQLSMGLVNLTKLASRFPPTLPEYLHACRNNPPGSPLVGPERQLAHGRWDKWQIAANHHLWAYLHGRDPKRYHPDAVPLSAQSGVHPGPEGTLRTQLLTEQKNLWAQDMRDEEGRGSGVDVETQKAGWAYRIGIAEERIDRRIAGEDVRPETAQVLPLAPRRDSYAERVDLDL